MPTTPARQNLRDLTRSRRTRCRSRRIRRDNGAPGRRTGQTAAYMTGAGVAASGFGLPDIGLVTATEMAERARMLVGVLGDIPLIADADTGYGAAMNVVRTVRLYEQAGVAAIQLEDQVFPKRCGHLSDKHVIDAEEFEQTLAAALDARTDDNLLVVARTDARPRSAWRPRSSGRIDTPRPVQMSFSLRPRSRSRRSSGSPARWPPRC